MDLIFSIALLIALLCGGMIVLAGGAAAFLRDARPWGLRALRFLAFLMALLSCGAGAISALIHATSCHGSQSREPMGIAEFLLEHRAYSFACAL